MYPNTIPMSFTVLAMMEEMKLRGTFIQFAVDAEFIVCMVIAKIYKEKTGELKAIYAKKGKGKDLSEMSMSERIEVLKIGLHKYHQPFYNSHKEEIEHLHTLRNERNAFAHQKMTFFEEDRDKIELVRVVNRLKLKHDVYSIKKMWLDMNAYMKSINKILDILKSLLTPDELRMAGLLH